VLLGGRDVLDEAAEAEGADGRRQSGLLVGESFDGAPEQGAVLAQYVDEVGALGCAARGSGREGRSTGARCHGTHAMDWQRSDPVLKANSVPQ
jgi:hypothetical protein